MFFLSRRFNEIIPFRDFIIKNNLIVKIIFELSVNGSFS